MAAVCCWTLAMQLNSTSRLDMHSSDGTNGGSTTPALFENAGGGGLPTPLSRLDPGWDLTQEGSN